MNPNASVFVPGGYAFDTGVSKQFVKEASVSTLPQVASTEEELQRVLNHLASEHVLAIDCEGADLSKGCWFLQECQPNKLQHGRLCLLQIGTMHGEAFALDILELGERAFELGLRALLEGERPIKVVHDFRQDNDALLHQFGVQMRGLFDCQLCDVMLRRLGGHRTGYVTGSAKLLSSRGILQGSVQGYGILTQEQKQAIHDRFSRDRHLWERRPLPQDMVEYALEDVKPMLQLQRLLLQELVEALGEQDAWQLVKEGSMAYAADFASQRECRCRLCCNAAENARFDGFRFMQRLQALPSQRLNPHILRRIWRQEDAQPLPLPGPSRFYVNEADESVPLPVS
ncbi:unnamed protein product [Durusdinium trenchii]|uniref:3'-5' exonuclease domain-containing protein n=1 Tax=Durusdinium trenchii TaxID=1381693 RepID=A0ABP0RX53_9DINO